MTLSADRIHQRVPEHILHVLTHSEVFTQAYCVADKSWVVAEDERFRPARIFALEDQESVAAWSPVSSTLTEFGKSYDHFVAKLSAGGNGTWPLRS